MAGSGRHPADHSLALAIAAGRTVAQAAASSGVSERTAYRRIRDPEFVTQVTACRRQMVTEAAGKLAAAMTASVDVLLGNLTEADANVRHRAACKVLELGIQISEHAELRQRLESIEQRLGYSK